MGKMRARAKSGFQLTLRSHSSQRTRIQFVNILLWLEVKSQIENKLFLLMTMWVGFKHTVLITTSILSFCEGLALST